MPLQFSEGGGLSENGAQVFLGGCDLSRDYGMEVIFLSFLCNYDNLALKLHQKKRIYPDSGWLLIGKFKDSMSIALAESKKVSKCIMSKMQDH